uniref:SH2 domain-containing protein 3C-like n=2 Tax=Hirondellea gigas TaxID=1518452 RepID=A0A6A7G3D2_9CRUS
MACDPTIQMSYGYNGAFAPAAVLYQYYGGPPPCDKGACAKACVMQCCCIKPNNKDHKLKGVDVKPRISLVEDRENSTEFLSVIHTPLPPTPTATNTSPTAHNSSFYSSFRKQSPLPQLPGQHSKHSISNNSSVYSPVNKHSPLRTNSPAALILSDNSSIYSPVSKHSPLRSNSPATPTLTGNSCIYSPVRKQSLVTPNSPVIDKSTFYLPVTPSSPTVIATSPTSTSPLVDPESLCSPIRKQTCLTPGNCTRKILSLNNSFKKTSKSSDSLLNSSREINPHNFSNSNTLSKSQHLPNRHSNLSIPGRYPVAPSESRHVNSHSSNPNILSPDTSSLQGNSSPSKVSINKRPSDIGQQIIIPNLPSRSNSISNNNSFPNTSFSPTTPTFPNNIIFPGYRGPPIPDNSNTISPGYPGSPTPSNNTTNFPGYSGSLNINNNQLSHQQNQLNRSYSTRSAVAAAPPSLPITRSTSSNEYPGYRAASSVLTIAPEDAKDVILRTHPSSQRRDHRKRTAGLLSPSSVAKMSFKYDSNASLEASVAAGDLSHLLEWELSLDSSDLRSHAWYHGNIPRTRAEEIVTQEGTFLVRDCTTQPGNYVLTCFWDDKLLHFVIQKTVVQPETVYERIQYELEDDSYDTIPDLICAYVGNKKVVTKATGAKILAPVNRSKPLSYYESLYKRETAAAATAVDATVAGVDNVTPVTRTYDNRQAVATPLSSTGVGCTVVRSSADIQQQRANRPVVDGVISAEERSSSSDGIIGHKNKALKDLSSSTQSLPRRIHAPVAEPSPEGVKPPPKPSRVPSFKVKARKPAVHITDRIYAEIDEKEEHEENTDQKPAGEHQGSPGGSSSTGSVDQNPRFSRISEVYQPSGSDSGNGSGDSIQTTASDARNRDSQGSLVDENAPLEEDSLTEEPPLFTLPDLEPSSCYNLDAFSTFLLPHAENPPLDSTALNGVRNTIMETGSRIIAAHLTYTDLEVLNGLPTQDFGLGVCMGIEMITLPQGSQLRKDLIERTECMRLLVAVTVLKAEDMRMRAEIIHRWIQIAIDTKTATGNLFGFNNIMLGLCNPQIQRLTATWHMVRQKFTDSAFSFESKLRSTLKSMNECNNPQAPNTVIPHILPFVMICERDLEDIYSLRRKEESLLQWESSSSDYGLQMMLQHLQEGRTFAQNLATYRRNAELILDDPESLEDLILDVFRTEFHLKFLFGSRGALRDSQERHAKFNQILSALSAHCESSVESSV